VNTNFKFCEVYLKEIDIQDRTFLFSFPKRTECLKDSIKKIGLLQPPILFKVEKKYKIIAGEGRILALIELGLEKTPAFTIYEKDPKKLLLISFESNAFRSLNLVEKAEFVKRAVKFFTTDEMISFLPLLGFAKHYSWLEFLKQIDNLILEFKKLLVQEELNPQVVNLIASLSEEEQKKLLILYERIKPSFSEQKKILQKLFDLKKRYSFDSILPDFFINILEEEDFNLRKKKFLEKIFELYYPNYSKKLLEIKPFIEKFRAKEIFVSPSPYFEKKELDIKLNIASEKDITKVDFLKENFHLVSEILKKM
jgi:ParB family chromosome partitioning protein